MASFFFKRAFFSYSMTTMKPLVLFPIFGAVTTHLLLCWDQTSPCRLYLPLSALMGKVFCRFAAHRRSKLWFSAFSHSTQLVLLPANQAIPFNFFWWLGYWMTPFLWCSPPRVHTPFLLRIPVDSSPQVTLFRSPRGITVLDSFVLSFDKVISCFRELPYSKGPR